MSNPSDTLREIIEINLSYLSLAQRLLREDKANGMLSLGVSEQMADLLANLTQAQAVRIASSNHLLCRLRFEDHAILSSLSEKGLTVEQRTVPATAS